MEQLELFRAKPERPPRRLALNPSPAPRWSKYNQKTARKPHQCDFCVLNCHEDALAPIPRKARYIRKAGGNVMYLCLHHANDQRVIDGLMRFRAT